MPHGDPMNEYLHCISQQIRWKKARPTVLWELKSHLQDQQQAYIREGMDPDAAMEQAIREMGDPVTVGAQLDRVYRPRVPWGTMVTALLLTAAGFYLRFSLEQSFSPGNILGVLFLCCAAFLGAMKLDVTVLLKTHWVYGVYLAGAVVLRFFPLPWNLSLRLTPYFLLLMAPLSCVSLMHHLRDRQIAGLWLCFGLSVIPLIVLYSTLSLLLLLEILLLMLYAIFRGGFPLRNIQAQLQQAAGLCTVVLLPILLLFLRFRGNQRFDAILHPQRYPDSLGYLYLHLRKFLSMAKPLGPMEGVEQLERYLPFSGADRLFTWSVCHFGWIPALILPLCMVVLLTKAVLLCRKQSGFLTKLCCVSILLTWGMQLLLSMTADLGIVLISSIPFPFLGSKLSAAVNMMLLGLLVSCFMRQGLREKNAAPHTAKTRLVIRKTQNGVDFQIRWR